MRVSLWLLVLAALGGCGGDDSGGRVAIIGLDGATWELLQPWIDNGDLPTLARLQQTWAWGEFLSSVPYLSPPAWTTAVTGVNPGKHAIFDFQRRIPGQAVIVNETAKSRRAQPVWNVLSAAGKRVLLLNIPMTDPPDEINGLCIAGFPHHDQVGFTYPADLEARLADYELDELRLRLEPGQEDSLLAAYHRGLQMRKEITLEWIRSEPFDLLWAVFTGTDRIQHTFWHFTDPENPHYDPARAAAYADAIHDYWVVQDAALGEILAALGPETTTLVISDHGFGAMRYDLLVQNYLRRAGSRLTPRECDMIYALDPNDAARLYVARRGRDAGAMPSPAAAREIRDKLVAELRAARDPRTGQPICDAVWVNEEVFHGTYSEKGPDVVAIPADGYFLVLGDPEADPAEGHVHAHGIRMSAWHRMNGIYAAAGPAIVPGRRDGEGGRRYNLLDIVPTIFYALGEPVPLGLDGELMRGVFAPDYLTAHPPEQGEPLEEDYREMSPEELQNLKNLPYIGG